MREASTFSRPRRGTLLLRHDFRLDRALALALLLLAPAASEATVVKAIDLAEKVAISSAVVHGTVDRVEAEWVRENAALRTRIQLRITECLKGAQCQAKALHFFQPGGKRGEFRHEVEGVEPFRPGDEVIMFLEAGVDAADLVPVGIAIGRYDVARAGRRAVVRFAPTIPEVRFANEQPVAIGPVPALPETELEVFKAELRRLVGQAALPPGTRRAVPLPTLPAAPR